MSELSSRIRNLEPDDIPYSQWEPVVSALADEVETVERERDGLRAELDAVQRVASSWIAWGPDPYATEIQNAIAQARSGRS